MKVINITRYHDADLQAVVDLFCRRTPKRTLPWGTETLYSGDLPTSLVFTEGMPRGMVYWGDKNAAVRNYVARSPWRAPHRVRVRPPDKIVENFVEMLTLHPDNEGYYRAPVEFAAQVYYTVASRFDNSKSRTAAADLVAMLESETARTGTSFCVRYRFSPKRRPTSESKEYELQYRMRVRLKDLRREAKRGLQALSEVSGQAEALLMLAKERTEGLPFDPSDMRMLLTELETSTFPAVRRFRS